MRAVMLVDKRKLEVKEIEEPISKNGEVVIEILKSGHHGANNTVSRGMIKTINPDAAIISTGLNPYGHPTKQTLKTFERNDVKVYRTDIDNAIKITSNGDSYFIYRYNTNSKKFEKDLQNSCLQPALN